jgi:glyoxylase-like metal-dependent hydrolase (beta-lactamase superfamily II)
MKKAVFAGFAAIVMWGSVVFGAVPRFEKVSDHCYYLQLEGGGDNVAAVITGEGVLLVNPPAEPDVPAVAEALKRVTSQAVRWVVFTDYRYTRSAGARYFARLGATFIASTQLRALSSSSPADDTPKATIPRSELKDPGADEMRAFPWFVFGRQMRVFPANLEVRIFALQQKALTGGDVAVFVPAEKVLFVGGLFESGRYPDIDISSEGSAPGWIDGLKQAVDSVPVLKSAIPPGKPESKALLAPKAGIIPAKPEAKPDQEKTLEEGIFVIPARGEVSNLQLVKEQLEAAQKLRHEISRALKGGSSCDNLLYSPNLDPFRAYESFRSFATQLCEALSLNKE